MSELPPDHPAREPDPEKVIDAAVEGLRSGQFDTPDLGELGKRLPQYEFQALVGRGGMGTVYRGVHKKLGRTVAIKIMPDGLAEDPAFGERFGREARALARLNHPNILTVFDFGETDGLFYIVTEFVDGLNLRQLLQMGELSLDESLRLLPQICQALQFAHDHGVVHRDIKPENVLIDQTGRVLIADFGLAKLTHGEPGAVTLTQTAQVLGTPHYMAPEQLRASADVDHRADIFSLGVITYEMLTGSLPVGMFDKPSKSVDVAQTVDDAVLRSLAASPEERYQKVSEFAQDLAPDSTSRAAPEAAAAEPRRDREKTTPVQAELCRLPILPAELIAFFLVVFGVSWLFTNSLLWFGLCAAGFFLSCVYGTIAGFVAISRIRAARGRLRGLGLAVVVAWFLPIATAIAWTSSLLWVFCDHSPIWDVIIGTNIALMTTLGALLILWRYHMEATVAFGSRPPWRNKIRSATKRIQWRSELGFLSWCLALALLDGLVLVVLANLIDTSTLDRFVAVILILPLLLASNAAFLWWQWKRTFQPDPATG